MNKEVKNKDTINESNDDHVTTNFIHAAIEEDMASGRFEPPVHTRFPPEPNGYLHIGHAKSICLNFTTAEKYEGLCNLRFDDTNPLKEEQEYINAIKKDVRWLGFDWEDRLYFASDYFEELYKYAIELIEKELAYVCDLSQDEIREYRGTLTTPGKNSPYRDRSVEENLELFKNMRAGKFDDGAKVLRAKIDMASPNIVMRDPVMYRIQRSEHLRTGNEWCIYPMYDFAHPISDSLEGITHSICTLEFENNRPLYEWFLNNTSTPCKSRQMEIARLNLSHTIMSKRYLRRFVEEGYVKDWDDPRMPTISGLRRRGYTPESIRDFAEGVGVAKSHNLVDKSFLEYCIRKDLNEKADRVMVVFEPLKIVITNYPEDKSEWLPAENNPEKEDRGSRMIPFGREIYIEQEDFMENPPKKFFRLSPGEEVRLKHAYIIKCEDVVKDEDGNITELHCTYDPDTKSGVGTAQRRVKGTLHWVSAKECTPVELRIYNDLLTIEDTDDIPEGKDFLDYVNPNSLKVIKNALAEPMLSYVNLGDRFQFLRKGYFAVDPDYSPGNIIFNQIVDLKDSWGRKLRQKQKQKQKAAKK